MTITIPFTQTDRQFVERHQLSDDIKARYFAAQATHRYLQRIGIPSTVLESETDAGLLEIPEVGRLRSCPLSLHPEMREKQVEGLQPLEDLIDAIWDYVPSEEDTESYIGDVWIDLDNDCRIGEVLGFTPPEQPAESDLVPTTILVPVTILKRWLEGLYDDSAWKHPIDLITGVASSGDVISSSAANQPTPPDIMHSHMKAASRAKTLRFGTSDAESVVLLVQITSRTIVENEEINVRLRVYPHKEQRFLLRGLSVTISDQSGGVVQHLKTGDATRWLECSLSCETSDQFSVEIAWEDKSVIEKLAIDS